MHKNIPLVVGITILFLGLAIQPSVATVQPEKETDVEPKDYLFQIIINIANNPDVKNLLEQYNHNLFTSDYDYRNAFLQLLFKKPRLLFNVLFTKPSITYNYLDKSYNRGIEITNIIGEDNVLDMIASIEVTNPELFNEFNNIIMNDEELSGRLATLKEINKEYVSDLSWGFPIICNIVYNIFAYQFITMMILIQIYEDYYYNNPVIFLILGTWFNMKAMIALSSIFILGILNCPQFPISILKNNRL